MAHVQRSGAFPRNLSIAFSVAVAGMLCAQGAVAQTLPTTQEDILAYQGPEREQLLYERAKEEGSLVWYTDHTQYALLTAPFEEKYPGIKAEPRWMNHSVSVLQQEYMARRHVFDVFEGTMAQVHALIAETPDMFTPIMSPQRNQMVPEEGGPLYVKTRSTFTGLGYNTNLVSEEEVPKTYQDLLDPKWKGKIAITLTEPGIRIFGVILETFGEEFATQLAGQLVAQEASGRALTDQTVAGEFPLHLSASSSQAFGQLGKNTPFDWQALEPVPATWAAIMNAKEAPHPFAAALFTDWVLSQDGGLAVYAMLGNGSPVAGSPVLPFELMDDDTVLKDVTTYPNIEERMDAWNSFVREVIVLKKE